MTETTGWEHESRGLEEEARVAQVLDQYISRHGDVVIVMGHDRVTGPPDGGITRRRYTNIWQLQGGQWRTIARPAQVVARTAVD